MNLIFATIVLGLLSLILAILWLNEVLQRRQLLAWLTASGENEIPNGKLAWEKVFSQLQRWHKESNRKQIFLTSNLERFRLAVQALPDGVVILDQQKHIEWINQAACEHFSLEQERDRGTKIGHLIRQNEFHVYLAKVVKDKLNQHKTEQLESIKLHLSNNHRDLTLQILLIPFADSGTLLLSRDESQLVRTEAIRRDFIANVSHELRTPLTVISGFIEQFLSDAPPSSEQRLIFLKLMAEQANRMNRLVTDLLTLSQLEADLKLPSYEVIDMSEMLESLQIEANALSNGRQKIKISQQIASNLYANRQEVISAFSNLLSNSVRYTPQNGEIEIIWRGNAHGEGEFAVRDSGIGIPSEHIPRLTERFYRVDKGRSTATGGTGLGLAIVKHVLLRHQGKLLIDSELGRGSTFSAVFPAVRLCD